jgi:threonine/homoserine/homoserine lactone efflux protein
MPSGAHLLAFTLAALLLIVVPGPSVLFVVSRALAYGRRTALITVAGNAAGSFVLAAAVAIGVGAIVATSAIAYTAVKLAGAAYLVYLGIRAFRHRRALREAFAERGTRLIGTSRTWWEGFVVGVTNPKGAVFFAAVLPQFVDRGAGQVSLQMLVLGAIFAVLALASDGAWGVAAGAVRDWFGRSTRRLELVGGAAGLTMVGLGLGLAVTGRSG